MTMHTAGEDEYKNRFVVGFVEPVAVINKDNKEERWLARVDSGATRSSIDKNIVAEMDLGPVIGTKLVKNANGRLRRDVILVKVRVANHVYEEEFTVSDRSQMSFKILLGRNILEHDFLIDPKKIHAAEEEE